MIAHDNSTQIQVFYSYTCNAKMDVTVSLDSHFKCKDSPADVVAVNLYEAWIASLESNSVFLYNGNGEEINNIKVDFKIQCFAVYDHKSFILSNYAGKSIYKMSSDGEMTKLVNTSPFNPNGIFVLKEDRGFLVCQVGTTGGKLVRYSRDGSARVQSIKNDKSGRPMYKFPRRVVENGNGDYVVVDIGSLSVIAIDKDGLHHWTYRGAVENKIQGEEFNPWDICSNSEQQLIISNTKNNSVELLNKDGCFLRHLITDKNGIRSPLGMSLDADGRLWVGHSFGKVSVFNYCNCH